MNGKPSWKKSLTLFCLLAVHACDAYAQSNPQFQVRLDQDFASAEKTLDLYSGLSGRPQEIAELPGSQIALATTSLLAQRHLDTPLLTVSLENAKFGQTGEDDVFKMKDARTNVRVIKELLDEIKRRNFAQRVASTVEQLFPPDASVSTTIPVFFVAFGHQNIDAYVRRVVWRNNVPVFVGEGEGELTIVVNLAKAVSYGRNVHERFVGTLSLVAHEVFHAAFGVYQDSSSAWREYRTGHTSYLDRLLELTQNEGIAHYLTFEQRTGGETPPDWDLRVRTAFEEFNKNALILRSGRISVGHAQDIIRASNTSGYWESYGAITGLFIARYIDQTSGRPALGESLRNGPLDFFATYAGLCAVNSNLPALAEPILQYLKTNQVR